MSVINATKRFSCLSRTIGIIFLFLVLTAIFFLILFHGTSSSTKLFINKIIVSMDQNKITNVISSDKIIMKDFLFDSNKTLSMPSYICDNHDPLNNHSSVLRSYCSKVPIPRNGWKRAQNYIESDIGFLIFTSSVFYHTRAKAVRETWLSRVTHRYFLSATPYPWLPLIVIEEAGEDKLSNMKKVFYGLQIIYKQQQNSSNPHKWYYLAGCDTFLNVPHILKRLDPFDYTKPFLIGGHNGFVTCSDSRGRKHRIEFPAGGPGFFISSKLLEIMMPHLTDYVENVWPRKLGECRECSDLALTCLAFKLGVRSTKVPGFWANNPDRTLHFDGRVALHNDPEPNTYHYVSYREMYDLDEFYTFQYIDRLVNDNNWKELTEHFRTFVSSHYELLRVKRDEDTLSKLDNITSSLSQKSTL